MKILYVAHARMPTEKAHGIQIMKMCQAFVKNGAEVELVIPRRRNKTEGDIFDYYHVPERFKVRTVFSPELIRFGKIGFALQNLIFSLGALSRAARCDADVVYSRDEMPLFFISFLKKKFFWETHGPAGNTFLVRRVIATCTGIIAISDGLKKYYEEHFGVGEKLVVARDAVDVGEFTVSDSKSAVRTRLGLPQDKKIALYAGHLYAWKGVEVLSGAAKYLADDTVIVFVGGTDEDLAGFREKYGRIPNIIICGRRPYTDIPSYLKSADVLVLPNSARSAASNLYTSPMKLFEYMASGVPIVASDVPAIREVLNPHNAVLVQPDDSLAIAKGVKIVLGDPSLAGRIAGKAWEDVGGYTWLTRASGILNLISSRL